MKKEKKPSKLDLVTLASAQDFAHAGTPQIVTRRNILQYEVSELDAEIVALQASIEKVKDHRKTLNAQIEGLGLVIAKR